MKPHYSEQICQSIGLLLYFLGSTVLPNRMYTVIDFFLVCSAN